MNINKSIYFLSYFFLMVILICHLFEVFPWLFQLVQELIANYEEKYDIQLLCNVPCAIIFSDNLLQLQQLYLPDIPK